MVKLRVREVLKRKRLSLRQLAKKTKTDYSAIVQMTKPTKNPKLRTMEKWAKAIGCRVRDLISEK